MLRGALREDVWPAADPQNVSARAGEHGCGRASDPRSGSGHDHDLIGEVTVHRLWYGHSTPQCSMFVEYRLTLHVGTRDPQHPDPGDITLIRVLAALSDPIRLGLLRLLADGQNVAGGTADTRW
ncbi:hypothetical protein [Streptomyces sp. V4I2]|uniref:hypothetical protein n=1 Tax=Streptomyces sp. V4I2 TaxID=3042280 RepID=UPI002787C861|nr:hypothetical protein [Streptomyces sp. V4I2]